MLLHAALIAEEKYVIYLFLVLALQSLLLSSKPCPELLYFLSQPLVLLLSFFALGLCHILFIS